MAVDRFERLRARNDEVLHQAKEVAKSVDAIVEEDIRVASVAGNAYDILEKLNKQFEEVTKLNRKDIAFLMFATALQCVRQYILTPFKERLGDKETAEPVHKQQKKVNNILFSDCESNGNAKWYYAPLEDIIGKPGVPYDAITGSAAFSLGLSGNTHRFKTLGHDPLLGWIFGTANIMTNTLTTNKYLSYHVKSGYIISNNADTLKVMTRMFDRTIEEPTALAAAVIKQGFHLKSDQYSKVGLPIPVISSLSAETAQKVAAVGVDMGNAVTVGKQVLEATFINYLIGCIHMLFYDKTKYPNQSLYAVKTRKILMYSNLLATSSNVIATAIGAGVNIVTGNISQIKDTTRFLDIGGIIVAIYRLVNDRKFIATVQKEFLEKEFYNIVMQ